MNRKAKTAALTALLIVLHCNLAKGQTTPPTTLTIDIANVVEYQADISDPTKFAKNANITPSLGLGPPPNAIPNFAAVTIIGDIVAVNGQAAKGIYAGRSIPINAANPAPWLGGAIADVTRTALRQHIFEIWSSDGVAIGTIMSFGFSGGPAPPGTPTTERANWAIVGGTGAFLGARGQVSGTGGTGRAASMAEDPGNRRINGGGSVRMILHVIPMTAPQIAMTPNGPAITHSGDFTLVSATKPAIAGEVLSLFATGLGPVVPAVDPGQPFSSNARVNSPVAVTVNGKSTEFLAAVGLPGAVDGYQVNFRMPPDIAKGTATVQVSAAWITSAPVSIAIQ